MAERIQKTPETGKHEVGEAGWADAETDAQLVQAKKAEGAEGETAEAGPDTAAGIDDLLDEIDDVLETNAEDFVKGYVQKGGE